MKHRVGNWVEWVFRKPWFTTAFCLTLSAIMTGIILVEIWVFHLHV